MCTSVNNYDAVNRLYCDVIVIMISLQILVARNEGKVFSCWAKLPKFGPPQRKGVSSHTNLKAFFFLSNITEYQGVAVNESILETVKKPKKSGMFSRESNKAQFGPKEYRHLNSLRRQQNATEPA